jgi:hypothetical protein
VEGNTTDQKRTYGVQKTDGKPYREEHTKLEQAACSFSAVSSGIEVGLKVGLPSKRGIDFMNQFN